MDCDGQYHSAWYYSEDDEDWATTAEAYDQYLDFAQTEAEHEYGFITGDDCDGWYYCDEYDVCMYCVYSNEDSYDYECGLYYCDDDDNCYVGEYTDIWMYVTYHSDEGEVDTWVHIDVVADAVDDDWSTDYEISGGQEGDCEFVKEYCHDFCYESCDTWC